MKILYFFNKHVINFLILTQMGEIMEANIPDKNIIFKENDIGESLNRIAEEILKNNPDTKNVVLIGIRTGGAYLVKRVQAILKELTSQLLPTGILDITLYRDDWTRIGNTPKIGKTEISFSIDNKTIILIDDVLFTGRTIRAAMDALIDFGRPKKIELAALVDRGDSYRELPIQANYVGGVWDISNEETINVYLKEEGFEDHVAIEKKGT